MRYNRGKHQKQMTYENERKLSLAKKESKSLKCKTPLS